MHFQVHFKRQKGAASSDAALGSDTAPAFGDSSGVPAADARIATKVGGIGNPIHRIAVGYRFDDGAAGTGADLTAALWAWDRKSEQWYRTDVQTLEDGAISYFAIPALADPPQTSANMNSPSAGGGEYLLVVADPGAGAATGVYHFVMGPDNANFPA